MCDDATPQESKSAVASQPPSSLPVKKLPERPRVDSLDDDDDDEDAELLQFARLHDDKRVSSSPVKAVPSFVSQISQAPINVPSLHSCPSVRDVSVTLRQASSFVVVVVYEHLL